MKRIIVATLFGVVAGCLCASIASAGHLLKLSTLTLAFTLLNRTVMGFVIGISALKLRWAWHGIVLGLVVGSIFSWFLLMNGMAPGTALLTMIGNAVWGLMIEFFTTVVFRQPAFPRAPRAVAAAAM